jgi:hypothetical protein
VIPATGVPTDAKCEDTQGKEGFSDENAENEVTPKVHLEKTICLFRFLFVHVCFLLKKG